MPKNTISSPADLLARVLGRIDPELLGETLEGLLTATTTARDGSVVPDNRVRAEALRLALGYLVGTPVQRSHTIEEKRGEDDTLRTLRLSPALREAVRRDLDRIDAEEGAEPD